MSAYNLYLFIHVSAAVVWVGASLVQAVLGARVVRAGDPDRTLAYARDCEWSGLHLYAPSNLLTLVTGLLMVFTGGLGFRTLWIDLGLAGWLLSVAIGGTLLKPGFARAAAISDPRAEADVLRSVVQRLVFITTVDLAVLTGVVYVMTVKPAISQPWSLAIGAAVVAVVLLFAGRLLRADGETIRSAGAVEGAERLVDPVRRP